MNNRSVQQHLGPVSLISLVVLVGLISLLALLLVRGHAERVGRPSARLITSGTFNGFSLEVWGEGPTILAARVDGLQLEFGGDCLEIKGGTIQYNGWKYGQVATGDAIKVTPEGALMVNGKTRWVRLF